MDRLGLVRTKLELLKQVVHLVERAQTKQEALEVLRRLLIAVEAEYEALLLDDPMVRWASLGLSESEKRLTTL